MKYASGAGLDPLAADCLTQLSGSLIVTPAAISSLPSRRARPPASHLDSRRPAGDPAPRCARDTLRLAPPIRDRLRVPEPCAGLH